MEKMEKEIEQKVRNTYGLISKKDGWVVFIAAHSGIEGTGSAWEKLGLTKKQYYTRLQSLVKIGLVHKIGDTYSHTSIGRLIFENNLLETAKLFKNIRRLEMQDDLAKTGKYTKKEIGESLDAKRD